MWLEGIWICHLVMYNSFLRSTQFYELLYVCLMYNMVTNCSSTMWERLNFGTNMSNILTWNINASVSRWHHWETDRGRRDISWAEREDQLCPAEETSTPDQEANPPLASRHRQIQLFHQWASSSVAIRKHHLALFKKKKGHHGTTIPSRMRAYWPTALTKTIITSVIFTVNYICDWWYYTQCWKACIITCHHTK